MLVPIAIFAVCLTAGAWAASTWLPDLDAGTVAGLAFVIVCGLLGAALGLVGLHLYLLVKGIEQFASREHGEVTASELTAMLWQVGILVGFALATYLLAPKRAAAAGPEPADKLPDVR